MVQYRYQYRPHLRRYPGIQYTGIRGPSGGHSPVLVKLPGFLTFPGISNRGINNY